MWYDILKILEWKYYKISFYFSTLTLCYSKKWNIYTTISKLVCVSLEFLAKNVLYLNQCETNVGVLQGWRKICIIFKLTFLNFYSFISWISFHRTCLLIILICGWNEEKVMLQHFRNHVSLQKPYLCCLLFEGQYGKYLILHNTTLLWNCFPTWQKPFSRDWNISHKTLFLFVSKCNKWQRIFKYLFASCCYLLFWIADANKTFFSLVHK